MKFDHGCFHRLWSIAEVAHSKRYAGLKCCIYHIRNAATCYSLHYDVHVVMSKIYVQNDLLVVAGQK